MARVATKVCLKGFLSGVLKSAVPKPLFNKRIYLHTTASLNVVGQEITMPSLSPTMAEGTIVKWLKKEGDIIAPGDVLCEIQTDKAVMSFETEEEGILAKIMLKDDSKDVKVGTVIALMVTEGEDWQSVEVPSKNSISTNASPTYECEVDSESSTGGVPGIKITMPSLSPTMSEGTIVKWYKKEGDQISPGDVLCDIQTDKAVMSFETEEEGILAKILMSEGIAKVGTLIAVMVSEGEDWKNVTIPSAKSDKPTTTTVSSTDVAQKTPDVSQTEIHNYGPAVRGLIELYQIDSREIAPSGKNKKLLKSDVLQYITDKNLQPKPPKSVPLPGTKQISDKPVSEPTIQSVARKSTKAKYVDIEISSMRKTIAKRLTESKISIPHAYITVESALDLVLLFRKQLKSVGINVSVNDFVVKAVALSLRECPMVNCLYNNDKAELIPNVDISVAVATDNGLITPIIKSADGKSVDEIASEIKELAGRARQGKLQLHEFQGGSFTISNLGMFGISEFSAIINPPQCGILAVGCGRPILDVNGKIATKMTAMLSYDARAISESAAADFLETVQLLLENPAAILTGAGLKKKARSVVL